eukprot:CAMPEP_0172781036 /NCGR_PEP_ID=MMETSP1074-20121228/203227_1 /TAXON_ID=2916 /ORGANISM="Ceratium fusus, Strain PA161109" /LENGTH=1337 /DNA_ID=CAMNT_0013618013 /DNA_START=13 /DNA_END=4026 /DNA_ORIENTATION=+
MAPLFCRGVALLRRLGRNSSGNFWAASSGQAPGAARFVSSGPKQAPEVVEVEYEQLRQMQPAALEKLREAFVGPRAYGAVAVVGVPGYREKRDRAFKAGIDLALKDEEGRARAAAVSNTYPGWSGAPGKETHPLQSSFLFNVKEELPNGKVDPYFGKNIFPSQKYREIFGELVVPMHEAAVDVLRGCDVLVKEATSGAGGSAWSNRSLAKLGMDGPALAGRFICYDSGFTREDLLLEQRNSASSVVAGEAHDEVEQLANVSKTAGHAADGLASMRTHSTPVKSAGHAGDGLASMRTHSTPVKSAGHAGDGLASMRTHSTPVKSAGHAGDGLASMRTHSTPIKSAGHAGDGLASMRTHSTPVKSAGHAGDGLASMRTHSTPVKSAGHASDGLASMRTHTTPVKSAGHAGDGLASMRTHSTPVKSAGHAGDGLASMRTHSTPIKSAGHAGDGLASMRTHSTPVKSAGHASDGLASMRTHTTPVKSAGHAGDGLASMRTHSTPVKSAGHAGDGLASMRTHSTPVKSAGHAGDGLASMRTHSTPVKSAGHAGDGLASMRTHSTPVKSAGHAGDGIASMRTHSRPVKPAGHANDGLASMLTHSTPVEPTGVATSDKSMTLLKRGTGSVFHAQGADAAAQSTRAISTVSMKEEGDVFSPALLYSNEVSTSSEQLTTDENSESAQVHGNYWLPWHIDSNFVTVLHREAYAYEHDNSPAPEPEGAGLLFMNEVGDVTELKAPDDVVIVQIGAFAQIYAGGHVVACRHAVRNPRPPGVARFNFCNFWYVPWDTVCETLPGHSDQAVNRGWNAMMDKSYLDITMRQSFAAFRQFMTSPEARAQFADSVRFKELAEMFPLPVMSEDFTVSCTDKEKQTSTSHKVIVDLLTDIRCPFSFLSQLNLERALSNLGLCKDVQVRYHPVFLNPNVPKEGESLDDYLLREYGFTKEYAHSEQYPLRVHGLKAGIRFNPDRRVVNTFEAFALVELAQELGKQRTVVRALSMRYFEEADDISDPAILRSVAEDVGLGWAFSDKARLQAARDRVNSRYAELASTINEVPHFLLRELVSGNGIEVGGNRSVSEWEEVLSMVIEKSRFIGMQVPGPHGSNVLLVEANPNAPVSLAVRAQHGWVPDVWPYEAADFSRQDESPDNAMYSEPRYVHHLDESSLMRLRKAYFSYFRALPHGFSVLDLCSSWASHYPQELLAGAKRVAVHGLNRQELDANMQATERHVQDLNDNPRLPWDSDTFDLTTMSLSVQYLTDPRAVFSEMHRVLKPGGLAAIVFSHRSFIEKAVRVWAKETYDGEGHVHLICRYFQHGPAGGWQGLTSIDISPQHGDPVWLVTALKAP